MSYDPAHSTQYKMKRSKDTHTFRNGAHTHTQPHSDTESAGSLFHLAHILSPSLALALSLSCARSYLNLMNIHSFSTSLSVTLLLVALLCFVWFVSNICVTNVYNLYSKRFFAHFLSVTFGTPEWRKCWHGRARALATKRIKRNAKGK